MIQKYMLPTLWITALISALFLIPNSYLELFGIAVILAFIWGWFSLTQSPQFIFPKSSVFYGVIALWLTAFISVILSDIISVSMMAFGLFTMLPLTFVIFTITNNQTMALHCAKITGVILTLLGLSAIIQATIFSDYFDGRAGYPLSNPNSLAALLSLGFFGFVGTSYITQNPKLKWLCVTCALVIFGGMMACSSRGALYAAVISLAIFFIVMHVLIRQNWRVSSAIVIGCIALFLLSALGQVENVTMFNRMTDFSEGSMNSIANNRVKLWQATWDMIQAHGLLGTGIGTYFLYFPEFRLSEDMVGATYAHNDPLQFWVELGIAGFVLFCTLSIAILVRTIHAVKASINTQQKLLILTPFFALLACLIHTQVTFNFYNLSIMFVSGLTLAIWFGATQNILKSPTKDLSFPASNSSFAKNLFLALPFVFIGSMCSAYILGEHYNNRAKEHLFAGELKEFADDVLLAQKIGLHGNYRPYLLATNVPLGLLEEEGAELNAEQRAELTQHAYGYISHVININPRSSSALYYMGYIQKIGELSALPTDMRLPKYYYTQALKIDPIHIGARLRLAEVHQSNGDEDKALQTLEAGKEYRYNTPMALDLYKALLRYYLNNADTKNRDDILAKIQAFNDRIKTMREKEQRRLSPNFMNNQHLSTSQ